MQPGPCAFYPRTNTATSPASSIHCLADGDCSAAGYIPAVEYLIVLWIGVIALLALAPEEVTKIVLAAGWLGVIVLTLAALVWRGWKALAPAG